MDEVSVFTPAPIRSRGRPRIYASSVEKTAAMRERLRAKGLVSAWVAAELDRWEHDLENVHKEPPFMHALADYEASK